MDAAPVDDVADAPASETGPLAALARYRASSAAIVVAFVLLSGLVGLVVGDDGGATTTMELTTPSPVNPLAAGGSGDSALARYTGQRAAFMTSDAVLGQVAQDSGRSIADLREIVSVESSPGSSTLSLAADAGDPAVSADLVDAWVQAYRGRSDDQVERLTGAALAAIEENRTALSRSLAVGSGSPEEQVAAAQAAAITLSDLDQQANALTTERAVFGDGVQFVAEATPGEGLDVPWRELALGLLVGLGVAAVVAWLRADRDRRVVSGPAAAAAVGAPLLGEVVQVDGYDDGDQGLSEMPAAPYRPVVPALSLRVGDAVLLVTSAGSGEGRTQTAVNLAAAMAREGRRVLLVDADVEGRGLSRLLGAGLGMRGVSDLLQGACGDPAALVAAVPVVPGTRIGLLPAGTPGMEPVAVQLPRVAELVTSLRGLYDLVVVDAAPLGGGGLPAVLARLADSVLVVTRRGAPWGGLEQLRHLLALYGTPVAGVLLTFADAGRRRRRHRSRRSGSSTQHRPSVLTLPAERPGGAREHGAPENSALPAEPH